MTDQTSSTESTRFRDFLNIVNSSLGPANTWDELSHAKGMSNQELADFLCVDSSFFKVITPLDFCIAEERLDSLDFFDVPKYIGMSNPPTKIKKAKKGQEFDPLSNRKIKVSQVIKVAELLKRVAIPDRKSQIRLVATSFEDFCDFMSSLADANRDPRAVLTPGMHGGFVEQLLQAYGEVPGKDNSKFHLGLVGTLYAPSHRILPGVTTKELIKYLSANPNLGPSSLISGLSSPREALEVAIMPSSAAYKTYAKLGLPSRRVAQLSKESAQKLDAFLYVPVSVQKLKDYVQGKPAKLESLLACLPDNIDLVKNFARFVHEGGDDFDALLPLKKLAEADRPSLESMVYAHKFLGAKGKDTVAVAKKIDTKPVQLFSRPFDSVEGFLAYKEAFESAKKQCIAQGGEKPAFPSIFAAFYDANIDIPSINFAYLSEFELVSLGSSDILSIQTLSALPFEDYKKLNVGISAPRAKAKIVASLLEKGVSQEWLLGNFQSKTPPKNVSHLAAALDVLGPEFTPDDALYLVEVSSSSSRSDFVTYARELAQVMPQIFSSDKKPWGLIPMLDANRITPKQIRSFGDVCGFDKYKSDKGFDALSLIRDLREAYNIS